MAALVRSRAALGCFALILCALSGSCSERSLVIFEDAPTNGGSPSTGGTGTSASGAGGALMAPGTLLIDDFEDTDTRAIEPAGWWYPVNDGSAEQILWVEPDPLRQSSSLHTAGQGFTDWGAALGVDLAEVPLDADFGVLRFGARGGSSREAAVQFIDDSGARFTHTLTITPTWQEYTVRLDQLYTVQGETFIRLDPSELNELHVFFYGGDAFDIWIDDVTFAPK
jgi:hypothetical protein